MPCVHLNTYGPESAGDDAALIQRKASFDTGRADRTLMMPEMVPGTTNSALDASVAQRQSATLTPWRSEGQHLPDALGPSCPLGGWSRMERQVDVAHLAGSSILLIHPGSHDPQRSGEGW
jgi:hypothetical protein